MEIGTQMEMELGEDVPLPHITALAKRWQLAIVLAGSLNAGDCLSYSLSESLQDMARDELARRLRERGLRMSTEDTDCIWIELI